MADQTACHVTKTQSAVNARDTPPLMRGIHRHISLVATQRGARSALHSSPREGRGAIDGRISTGNMLCRRPDQDKDTVRETEGDGIDGGRRWGGGGGGEDVTKMLGSE